MKDAEFELLMNNAGWYRVDGAFDMDVTDTWFHLTVTKANGDSIGITDEIAKLHQQSGTTPPPF